MCMFLDNFWWLLLFWLLKHLDVIPPLFDGWRWYLYQILFKKAFVEHEISYFNFPSTWKDSTHWKKDEVSQRERYLSRFSTVNNQPIILIILKICTFSCFKGAADKRSSFCEEQARQDWSSKRSGQITFEHQSFWIQ